MALLLGLAFAPGLRAQTPPQYVITDLGTLGGGYSTGYGINNSGQVTGYSDTAYYSSAHAFLYASGSMSNLGTLGGTTSTGYGINDSGQVTGYSDTRYYSSAHAFLYASGSMSNLGTLGGTTSTGYGINDSGQVTGESYTAGNGATRAFLYSGGSMSDLGTLGGTTSTGYGINNSGQVTGSSSTMGYSATHAFLYSGGSMSDLGTLGGTTSVGAGINDAGQVTGYSGTAGDGTTHAFLYSGGSMSDLGTLGGTTSMGWGINNSGQVTGYSYTTGDSATHAFLYSGGTMYDLNDLVGASPVATNIMEFFGGNHINDWGQIAAQGTVSGSGGQVHALLLSPVDPLTSTSGGGASRETKFVVGMSYGKFTATTDPGNLHTEVSLLGGTAGSGGTGVFGLNRNVTITFSAGTAKLASDILTLQGTAGAGFADTIVLQLTYDSATAIALFGDEGLVRLGWLDNSQWLLATAGNTGAPGSLAGFHAMSYADFLAAHGGMFDPVSMLGAYGTDTAANTVWGVIDHNSDFAASAVPEPSALGAMLTLGLGALIAARRWQHPRQLVADLEHG